MILSHKMIDGEDAFMIDGSKIERVKEFSYLGNVIDDKLDFNSVARSQKANSEHLPIEKEYKRVHFLSSEKYAKTYSNSCEN